jgi:hypothetical protein
LQVEDIIRIIWAPPFSISFRGNAVQIALVVIIVIVDQVACQELRNNRLFLKLLEVVLKTGNRMNAGTFRGGAQTFKLDTLLKLSDV